MTTNRHAFYTSPIVRKQVTEGFITQEMDTRVLLFEENGNICLTVSFIGGDGEQIGEYPMHDARPVSPVFFYRIARLIESLPKYSRELVAQAVVTVGEIANPFGELRLGFFGLDLDAPSDDRIAIEALVGPQVVEECCVALPPEIEGWLNHLWEAGIRFDSSELVREVDAGRLQVTPELKSLGVDSSKNLHAWSVAMTDKAKKFAPALQRYLGDGHQDCQCLQLLINAAAHCLTRGVEEEPLVVGCSILSYLQMRRPQSIYINATDAFKAFVGGDKDAVQAEIDKLRTSVDAQKNDVPDSMKRELSNFLAVQYGAPSDILIKQICDLQTNLQKMRIVAA